MKSHSFYQILMKHLAGFLTFIVWYGYLALCLFSLICMLDGVISLPYFIFIFFLMLLVPVFYVCFYSSTDCVSFITFALLELYAWNTTDRKLTAEKIYKYSCWKVLNRTAFKCCYLATVPWWRFKAGSNYFKTTRCLFLVLFDLVDRCLDYTQVVCKDATKIS